MYDAKTIAYHRRIFVYAVVVIPVVPENGKSTFCNRYKSDLQSTINIANHSIIYYAYPVIMLRSGCTERPEDEWTKCVHCE